MSTVSILEGMTVDPTPASAGAKLEPGRRPPAIIQGRAGGIIFDDALLRNHVLFLGDTGTGKTNAMKHLVKPLRRSAGSDDAFVVFDAQGELLKDFYQPGDVVISNHQMGPGGSEHWNLFAEIAGQEAQTRRGDIFEMASAFFSEDLVRSSQNYFFAAGARDIFGAVVESLAEDRESPTNAALRSMLESPNEVITKLITAHPDLSGNARYLRGEGTTPGIVRAFLQQATSSILSSSFGTPGAFSVRRFVQDRGARALFIEYDIVSGGRLSPVYGVLMDLAIKEALRLGRAGRPGNLFVITDEASLMPRLSHLSDGIHFGHDLGLKLILGTQNIDQVLFVYGAEAGRTILSGFGSMFAFRLLGVAGRRLVQERYGTNRKQVTTELAVRSQGVQQDVVMGNVIEDWAFSALHEDECIVCLPDGAPFCFTFRDFSAV